MKSLWLLFQIRELSVRSLEQLRAINSTLYLCDNTLCLDTAWAQWVDTLILSAPMILEVEHIELVCVRTRGRTAEVPVGCCRRCWCQITFPAVSCRWLCYKGQRTSAAVARYIGLDSAEFAPQINIGIAGNLCNCEKRHECRVTSGRILKWATCKPPADKSVIPHCLSWLLSKLNSSKCLNIPYYT